jgi:small subunit ribosomal protein S20
MPKILSAVKRARQADENRVRNRKEKAVLLTQRRALLSNFESKDKPKAFESFKAYCSFLDKAAKKGIIKKNTADRKKARASRLLTKIG